MKGEGPYYNRIPVICRAQIMWKIIAIKTKIRHLGGMTLIITESMITIIVLNHAIMFLLVPLRGSQSGFGELADKMAPSPGKGQKSITAGQELHNQLMASHKCWSTHKTYVTAVINVTEHHFVLRNVMTLHNWLLYNQLLCYYSQQLTSLFIYVFIYFTLCMYLFVIASYER